MALGETTAQVLDEVSSVEAGLSSQMGHSFYQMHQHVAVASARVGSRVDEMSARLGAMVSLQGERAEIAQGKFRQHLDIRLAGVEATVASVGQMLATGQGDTADQLARLSEKVQDICRLLRENQAQKLRMAIRLVAASHRAALAELQTEGSGAVADCGMLRDEAHRLKALVDSILDGVPEGDPRRATLVVPQVYGVVAEVDGRLFAELIGERARRGGQPPAGPGAAFVRSGLSGQATFCRDTLLADMLTQLETEVRALLRNHATSAYATAVVVAPTLAQYALLCQAIRAKQDSEHPVIFQLPTDLQVVVGPETQLQVKWEDGLDAMRALSLSIARNGGSAGEGDWLEMQTVDDALWLADLLEAPRETCPLASVQHVHQKTLLEALGVPHAAGSLSREDFAVLKAVAVPKLRELVERAINAQFAGFETPLTLPDWPKVAELLRDTLDRQSGEEKTPLLNEPQREPQSTSPSPEVEWNLKPARVFTGHTDRVADVAWSPDGSMIASAADDGAAVIWGVTTGSQLLVFEGHQGRVAGVAWSPDGSTLATASYSKIAVLWDVKTGARLRELRNHGEKVTGVAWSPDGRPVATASLDETAMLWDVETGTLVQTLVGHSEGLLALAWAPDGSAIATASSDKKAMLWDARTQNFTRALEGHTEGVAGVAWCPNRAVLATASWDGTSVLWNAADGRRVQRLTGHTKGVKKVSWSANGSALATASSDKTSALWDVETGCRRLVLDGHKSEVTAVAWSPLGNGLVTASDNNFQIWV
eukprot:TRINITY_DN856_c0_g2_i1.p1 TRINITY_DN856_c0_g2~~TRINITY_DN856_c0_g2_i1.p1  ORF type:complete len:863 (+),score=174.21 TRINITY_DN856_c0_g2_i1:293-2590(+)